MFDRKVLICLATLVFVAGGTMALAADNAAAPAQKPLMSLLDQAGVAKPLQDAGINIFGYVEGSYTYSASSPPNNTIAGRAFDYSQEDPTLNQLNVTVEKIADVKKAWDWGFRMQWMWGNDCQFIHSVGLFDNYDATSGPDNQFDLTQMYVDLAVPVGNGLLVRVGKFYGAFTPESIDPTQNALFSHSFLASMGVVPATLTGVDLMYQVSDDVSAELGIVRGWNGSLEDNNDAFMSVLWGAKWTIDKSTSASLRGTFGPEQTSNVPYPGVPATDNPDGDYRFLVDAIITHAYSDQLSITAEGLYLWDTGGAADDGNAQLWGGALYASYKVDSMFTVNARGEWFHNEDVFGSHFNAYEATLGVTITPMPNDAIGSNLKVRPEIRMDYIDPLGFDDGTDHYQFTIGVDAFFTF